MTHNPRNAHILFYIQIHSYFNIVFIRDAKDDKRRRDLLNSYKKGNGSQSGISKERSIAFRKLPEQEEGIGHSVIICNLSRPFPVL